jgi:prepilin-type N-terminal cleavage/methylation domain-containing protein
MNPKITIAIRDFRHGQWTTHNGQPAGFTLIELIVVIALLGLMLFFSLPRLQNNPFLDDSKKSSRWLIGKIQSL